MKKIFIIVLSLLLFFLFSYFLFPSNSKAATLEVGAGRTYSTIQAALNLAVAGDTVLIYAGTYAEFCTLGTDCPVTSLGADAGGTTNIMLVNDGTPSAYITIKSAGDGAVIIDGQSARTYNLYALGRDYYSIEGIQFKDAVNTSLKYVGTGASPYIYNGVKITGNTFTGGAVINGINIDNSGAMTNNPVEIKNNTLTYSLCTDTAIEVDDAYNALIQNNTVSGCDQGIYSHPNSEGTIIERNTVTASATDLTGIFIRDAANVIVRYNLIKGAFPNYGIYFQDSAPTVAGVQIYNNTVDCDSSGSTGIYSAQTWATVYNNIMYQCFVGIRGIDDILLPAGQPGYNIFYGGTYQYYDQISVVNIWPIGTGNLTSDPLFVSAGTDYRLQSSSPAIDAGDPATSSGIDYAGTIVPQGSRADIGAFEYISAGPPPDTTPPSAP